MLGQSDVQNWYASANSIHVQPRIVCEWNANGFAKPYVWGNGDGVAVRYNNTYQASPTAPCLQATSASPGWTTSTGKFGDTNSKLTITIAPTDPSVDADYYSLEYYPESPNTDKAYRLMFFGSSLKIADITIVATAYDLNGNELGNTSKVLHFNTLKKDPMFIDFFRYNNLTTNIKKIVFDFYATNEKSIEDINGGTSLSTNLVYYIDSPTVYAVTQMESSQILYSPVEDVFKINRPGDPYISDVRPGGSSTPVINNGNICQYYMAYSQFSQNSIAKGRSYFLDRDAIFKYFVFKSKADLKITNNRSIFVKYENTFNTNKIVIKINSLGGFPSAVTINTLADNSSGTSWVNAGTFSTSPFSAAGLLTLYWNGTAWSKNKYTISNNPDLDNTPKYTDNTLPASVAITGLRVDFTIADTDEVHLVEISPRLEMDISDYVINFNISKELSNDSLPTPIGIANSNTATITLSNLPNQTNNKRPFGNNYNDTLYDLIGKDVKLSVYVRPVGSDISREELKVASMISSTWNSPDNETSRIEAYDLLKVMSQTTAPIIYVYGKGIAKIVSTLLDVSGFTDYKYSELSALECANYIIPHYWTVKNITLLEAIQKILLPYQVSMYADEYGVLRFKHISELVNPVTADFTVTDTTYTGSGTISTISPNIISFNELQENSPSSISVKYSNISVNEITVKPNEMGVVSFNEKLSEIWNAPTEILGMVRLREGLTKQATRLKYMYNPQQDPLKDIMQSFSGYVLVGEEIIKFNGRLFRFTVNSTTNTKTYQYIINSQEELNNIVTDLLAEHGGSVTQEDAAELCNLTRGCFGTRVKNHLLTLDTNVFTIKYDDSASTATRSSGSSSDISEDNYSIKINQKVGKERIIAFYNSKKCSADHRIFSGMFSFEETLKDGEVAEYGLLIGSDHLSSYKNGLYVGTKIEKVAINTQTFYNLYVTIRQYDSNGSAVLDKTFTVLKNELSGSKEIVTTNNSQNILINEYGTNTISALLDKNNNLAVFVNGNMITFPASSDNSIKVGYLSSIITTGKISKKSFSIPAIKLQINVSSPSSPAVIVNERYIAGWSSGKSSIKINSLNAYELTDDLNIGDNLAAIATIINGNMFALSNIDELESVVNGTRISDNRNEILFSPDVIAREIREFDIEYQYSPVRFSKILRNSYTLVQTVDNVSYSIDFPAEVVTISNSKQTHLGMKFAMLNSYNSPIYLNKGGDDETGVGQNTTQIIGSVIKITESGILTQKLDQTGSSAEARIESDWVQNKTFAQRILNSIVRCASLKRGLIDVEIFGNPTITIGDIVQLQYVKRSILVKNYAVVSVQLGFDNGLTTKLRLRRVEL